MYAEIGPCEVPPMRSATKWVYSPLRILYIPSGKKGAIVSGAWECIDVDTHSSPKGGYLCVCKVAKAGRLGERPSEVEVARRTRSLALISTIDAAMVPLSTLISECLNTLD